MGAPDASSNDREKSAAEKNSGNELCRYVYMENREEGDEAEIEKEHQALKAGYIPQAGSGIVRVNSHQDTRRQGPSVAKWASSFPSDP